MESVNLDKDKRDKVHFITFIIPEFARAYKMDRQEAYRILKKYGGLEYAFNNWRALHMDNPYWVVREMLDVCRYNGFKD
jgi:hypothetical protein